MTGKIVLFLMKQAPETGECARGETEGGEIGNKWDTELTGPPILRHALAEINKKMSRIS